MVQAECLVFGMSFHSCSWVQVPPSHLWVEFRFHLSSPRFISSTHLACIWDQSLLDCLLPHAEPDTVSLVLLRLVLMLCFVSPVYPPTNQHSLLPSRWCWSRPPSRYLLNIYLPTPAAAHASTRDQDRKGWTSWVSCFVTLTDTHLRKLFHPIIQVS